MRDKIIIHRSIFEALKCLDTTDREMLTNAITDFIITVKEPNLIGIPSCIWGLVKMRLQMDNKLLR